MSAPRKGSEAFVKLRVGLHEHFTRGDLTEQEGYLFLRLLLAVAAEGFPEVGVVWTSAADVHHRLIPSWSLKKAQRHLSSLQAKGYVRSWRCPGSRGTYPVTVHLWDVPFGETRGSRINAHESEDYRRPAFLGETHRETHRETRGETRRETRGETPHGDTVLQKKKKMKREDIDGESGPAGGSEEAGRPEPDLAPAKALVAAFDQALADRGLPTDRRSQGALRRDVGAAARLLAHLGRPLSAQDVADAVDRALSDSYLTDRGIPFALFASAAPKLLRAGAIASGTRTRDPLEALARIDRETETDPR